MRPPDPGVRLYWFAGGDIFESHPQIGARPVALETAARLHGFHLAELDLAAKEHRRGAYAFHLARERDLRLALQALSHWRRAARSLQIKLAPR